MPVAAPAHLSGHIALMDRVVVVQCCGTVPFGGCGTVTRSPLCCACTSRQASYPTASPCLILLPISHTRVALCPSATVQGPMGTLILRRLRRAIRVILMEQGKWYLL